MAELHPRPIYALPLPTSSYSIRAPSRGKRKRSKIVQTEEKEWTGSNTEYSAVVTPEERTQRRLAGQPLDQLPPPAPFPHASADRGEDVLSGETHQGGVGVASLESKSSTTLRNTHLAVMVAILHKSLEQKEYHRAAKAIAIILRTEISGRSIDIRHVGLWGIGAEILVRNHSADQGISRKGFDRARTLYDKLALQHPWHRSWPNVIDAQDFKLAMFDLWIYTVCTESKRVRQQATQDHESASSSNDELQARKWELGEADAISKEMDSLMGAVPFIDHLELIRLRAFVALWTADLINTVDLLSAEGVSDNHPQASPQYEAWPDHMDDHQEGQEWKSNDRAIASRAHAQRLLVKLGIASDGALAQFQEDEDIAERY